MLCSFAVDEKVVVNVGGLPKLFVRTERISAQLEHVLARHTHSTQS